MVFLQRMRHYILPAILGCINCLFAQNGTVDTSFTTRVPIWAPGLAFTPLFKHGDYVKTPTDFLIPSKDKLDYVQFIPDPKGSERGLLWVNHETAGRNGELGDGGGATVLELHKKGKGYEILGTPRSIDFSSVGGTWNNCLGALTPWGTILTSEEYEPWSNAEIWNDGKGLRDTSIMNGKPRFLNYGWMVEVDPRSGMVLGKRWAMGRFSHEGALCMPDMKTVYLLDDFAPGIFFKFIADEPGKLESGTLYAYRQSADGNTGDWIPLPRDRDSLDWARDMALKRGATIFTRLEDLLLTTNGTILMTETGKDSAFLGDALLMGGKLAQHDLPFLTENVIRDYHGRLLRFDPASGNIRVWLEGGNMHPDGKTLLSNPDNIAIHPINGNIMIQEDINGAGRGRTPNGGHLQSEVYLLSSGLKQPVVTDLARIAVFPWGAEPTGGCWDPTGKVLFICSQHPDNKNPEPWNRCVLMQVTGWK